MSLRDPSRLWITALLALVAAGRLPASAQYPGQIAQQDKKTPELRAVAVLEWTGEAGQAQDQPPGSRQHLRRPGSSRMRVSTWPGRSRWRSIATWSTSSSRTARPIGLFDIKNAGQEQGSWVGFGEWKALPKPKPRPEVGQGRRGQRCAERRARPAPQAPAAIGGTAQIRRRRHASRSRSANAAQDGTGDTAPGQRLTVQLRHAGSDPDRPTLHKAATRQRNSTGNSGSDSDQARRSPIPTADDAPNAARQLRQKQKQQRRRRWPTWTTCRTSPIPTARS